MINKKKKYNIFHTYVGTMTVDNLNGGNVYGDRICATAKWVVRARV